MADAAFFVSGGTLPLSAGSYVERAADRALYEALASGRYAYVLNARQMGKSSLCVRTIARLETAGTRTAFVDLTRIGGRNLTAEQWYIGLLSEIARGIGGRAEMLGFWKASPDLGPMQRFFGALAAFALPEGAPPLVVFVDEVDAARSLPFSADEFFGGIRECYNRRAYDPAFERLTFCLLGAAIPSDLIRDMEASPFNVGERIAVKDFTKEEATAFAAGLASPLPSGGEGPGVRGAKIAQALVERVHYWTGGHPFLTQSLCARLAETRATAKGDVDRIVELDLFAPSARESNVNLADVGNRVLLSSNGDDPDRHRSEILALYDRIRRGKQVEDDESNPRLAILKLSGLVVAEGGLLRMRNRVYARVFGPAWIAEHTPDGEARRVRRAYRRGVFRATAVGGSLALAMTALAGFALTQAKEAERARFTAERAKAEADARSVEVGQLNASLQSSSQRLRVALDRAKDSLALAELRQRQAVASRSDAVRAQGAALRSAADAGREAIRANGEAEKARRAALAENAQRQRAVAATGVADARLRTALAADAQSLMQRGDDSAALRPLVTGLRLVANDPRAAELQRRRIGFALQGGSGLRQVWPTKGAATASALSPDGRVAAVGDAGGDVHLWDVETGAPVGAPMHLPGASGALVFSPDGKILATGGGAQIAWWNAANGRPLRASNTRPKRVNALVFSHDGRLLVSAEGDGVDRGEAGVSIFDAATGAVRGRAGFGGEAIPEHLDISPDGTRIAVGSRNFITKMIVIDRQGVPTGGDSVGGSFETHSVRFSRDGRWLAVAGTFNADGSQGNAMLNDGRTGADVVRYHDRRIDAKATSYQSVGTAAEFSPHGDTVIVANSSGVARLWGTLDGVPQGPPLRHDSPLVAAVFSPDGSRVATGCTDGSIRVWDPRTGEPVGSPFRQEGRITGLAYDPSGTRLLSSGEDGSARIWEVGDSGHGAHRVALDPPLAPSVFRDNVVVPGVVSLVLRDHDGNLYDAAVRPGAGRADVVGGGAWRCTTQDYHIGSGRFVLRKESRIQVWDSASNRPLTPELPVVLAGGDVRGDLDSTGRVLVAEEVPGVLTARRVDAEATAIARLKTGPSTGIVPGPGGEWVVFTTAEGGGIWHPRDGKVLHRWDKWTQGWSLEPTGRHAMLIRTDASGRRIGVRIVDLVSGRLIDVPLLATEDVYEPWVVTTAQVTFLFYGAPDRRWVARWDLATGRFIGKDRLHAKQNFAYGSEILVVGDATFDVRTGRLVSRLDGPIARYAVIAFAPSPHATTFAIANERNEVSIVDGRTGHAQRAPIRIVTAARSLAFSLDGTMLATGGDNGDVRVWDARTGEPVTPVVRHANYVSDLRFVEDDRALVVAADGLSLLPIAPEGRPVADLARLTDLVSAGVEGERAGPAGWNALRNSYPREFVYRTAHPKPVAPAPRDDAVTMDDAVREASLRLDDTDAWFAYALSSARMGRWQEGLAAVDHAEKAGFTGPAGPYLQGLFLARLGRKAEAFEVLQAARRTYPARREFPALVADSALGAGEYLTYATTMDEILADASPERRAFWQYPLALAGALGGHPDEARRRLASRVATIAPGMVGNDANNLAWELSVVPGTLADYGPVVRVVEPIVRAKPDAGSLNTLGLLLLRAGRDADAQQAIEAGLKLGTGTPEPSDRFVIGASLLHRGRAAEALPHLRAAVAGFEAQSAATPPTGPSGLEVATLLREARELLRKAAPTG